MKKRFVTNKEVNDFISALSDMRARNTQSIVKSKGIYDKAKVTCLSEPDKAVTMSTINYASALSSYDLMLANFQEMLLNVTGIKPLKNETPMDLLDMVSRMGEIELMETIQRNGIIWECWITGGQTNKTHS